MYKNEFNIIKKYLQEIINEEKHLLTSENTKKFQKYNIEFYPIFSKDDNEYFYLVARNIDRGIYFNDIEEQFGICDITADNECQSCEEYDGSLNSVLSRV
jgi:coproporphyrinogen III oxidase